MSSSMNTVERPLRTGIQVSIATALVEFINQFIFDMTTSQYAAAVVLLSLILAGLMQLIDAWLVARGKLPLFGRESPSG